MLPLLLASLITAAPTGVLPLTHSDFEFDFAGWKWYTHTVDGGGIRIGELSANQSRKGSKSARFVMDRSQGGLFHRAMFRKTDGFTGDGDERWIAFSTYFPATGPDAWVKDSLPELIFQLHNDPDASPILGLYCDDGKLAVEYRWAKGDPASNADVSTRSLPVGPQETGRWVDWVFHVKPAPGDSSGILEAWKSDAKGAYLKVVDKRGIPLGYPNGAAPAIDIGLYKWPWKTETYNGIKSEVDRRVVYFDEFRLMGPEGSLQAVAIPGPAGLAHPVSGTFRTHSLQRPVDLLGRAWLSLPP